MANAENGDATAKSEQMSPAENENERKRSQDAPNNADATVEKDSNEQTTIETASETKEPEKEKDDCREDAQGAERGKQSLRAPRRTDGRRQESAIRPGAIKTLAELTPSADADSFVQLVEKERLRTKDGKPYYKTIFRDRKRSFQALVWLDSPLFASCEKEWRVGRFYKIRASIRDSAYGVKLEIKKIREVVASDKESGFTPNLCRPSSETPPETLTSEILALANAHIAKGPLLNLIHRVVKARRLDLQELAASREHHRSYVGGLLEHTRSVTKIAIALTEHFLAENPRLRGQLSKSLVVAGAILHDFGKLLDTNSTITGPQKTVAGELIGHAVLGLEIVNQYAQAVGLDQETRVQLEHLILTHSRFADWGAPTPPATLEAMILHYADYADSTFSSALKILDEDASVGDFTLRKSPFGTPLFKPPQNAPSGRQTPTPAAAAAPSPPDRQQR